MDPVALRIANLLVGNEEDAAVLEITLRGPRLKVDTDALVAITGAEIDATCGGHAVPAWRPVLVRAGGELAFGGMPRGTRAYLAIAGGITLAEVLGSRSSDVNAGIGPLPRPLAANDALPCAPAPRDLCSGLWRTFDAPARKGPRAKIAAPNWSVDPENWFDYAGERPIRAIAGAHFEMLDIDSKRRLFGADFRVGVDSNRVGCRLEGPTLALRTKLELISTGVASGTVQLPPAGTPIVLAAEGPTTGGYPRVAHVIAVDQGHLAQRRPGDVVRFAQTDLDDAQMRHGERERALARLAIYVRERLRHS
jgi:antagonist of KipI